MQLSLCIPLEVKCKNNLKKALLKIWAPNKKVFILRIAFSRFSINSHCSSQGQFKENKKKKNCNNDHVAFKPVQYTTG